jgi:hypothetical protein
MSAKVDQLCNELRDRLNTNVASLRAYSRA